jgi:signal transduction histidine kinase
MSSSESDYKEQEKKFSLLKQECKKLQEKVSEIERDKIEYLQNVAHQLVAPLNAIKWHIENITESRIGVQRARKVLRSIYSQATIAVHLAKNFTLMSNLEADHALTKLKEPLEEVNLCKLLVNLADDFQPLAWDRNINIVVDQEHFDTQPPVLVMKPLISQVFSNIIENAVKYASSDTKITIQGKHVKGADQFSVSVLNQGIPLKPELYEKIFDRGVRSEEAKRKYPAGTGFGLYIARRIVEIHEGTIKASVDDGLTVFTVILSVRGLQGKARIREQKNNFVN